VQVRESGARKINAQRPRVAPPPPPASSLQSNLLPPHSAAAGRLALNGRVLGISGIAGGLARGSFDAPRIAFTAGLLGAGALALPASALQTLPASFTLARALSAGALVGVGSALGGGCTSGHGICGNARLSGRSAAFTGVMMACGAVAAAASGARAAVGLAGAAATGAAGLALAPHAAPAVGAVAAAARLLAAAVGTLAALALAGRARPAAGELVSEAAVGGLFALGLGVSGMLRPAKVIAFLTPLAPGGWDASLGVVMAGALAVSVPVFQRVLGKMRGGGATKPACASCYSLPSKTAVDGRLLGGAVLFGAGWGVGGICPGPGLVSAVAGGGAYVPWCAAFLAAHALTSSVVG